MRVLVCSEFCMSHQLEEAAARLMHTCAAYMVPEMEK